MGLMIISPRMLLKIEIAKYFKGIKSLIDKFKYFFVKNNFIEPNKNIEVVRAIETFIMLFSSKIVNNKIIKNINCRKYKTPTVFVFPNPLNK